VELLTAHAPTPPRLDPAATLSRESRWLRLTGIMLVLVCFIAAVVLDEIYHPAQLLRSGESATVAWIVTTGLAVANAFALGLVLLLAGLRRISLLESRQSRRGVLARMAAVNLILPCVALAMIVDTDYFGEEIYERWYVWPILLGYILLARASIRLFRSGWQYDAPTADDVLASDPRRPVLYLRSFAIDDQILATADGIGSRIAGVMTYTASISPEQEMAFIMDGVGPVVAIGRPGEKLPQLGAARRYVPDHRWRDEVGDLMDDAAVIVIRGGETASLWWEIETAIRRRSAERVLIMTLGQSEAIAAFDRRFAASFGTPAAGSAPTPTRAARLLRLLLSVPVDQSLGKIIYFDAGGLPREERIWFRLTWSGSVLAPYRPYRDSLQGAFRRVFSQVGLAYAPKRTQTAAVLLAMFGGIFGLHHFYMRQTRKGFWYAGFFWVAIPFILGWIDAVRLALLTEPEFQARVRRGEAAGVPVKS
jgi:hypothetical protein